MDSAILGVRVVLGTLRPRWSPADPVPDVLGLPSSWEEERQTMTSAVQGDTHTWPGAESRGGSLSGGAAGEAWWGNRLGGKNPEVEEKRLWRS